LATLFIDEAKFQQIFGNLLSNAVNFTPARGRITVRVIASNGDLQNESSDSSVGVEVRDTGLGIPPASIAHVFDRCYRVSHSDGLAPEGTGIGLALVRELTELHGGFAEAESQEGEGSVFRVWLPAGCDHLTPSELSSVESPSISDTGAREHIRSGSFQTVSDLATAVGFRSPAYFSRRYRAEFGDNPRALLKVDPTVS